MFARLDVDRHIQARGLLRLLRACLQKSLGDLPLLLSEEFLLFDDLVLSLDVAVGLGQLDDGVEALAFKVPMEEHAVRQAELDVTDLDRHVRG